MALWLCGSVAPRPPALVAPVTIASARDGSRHGHVNTGTASRDGPSVPIPKKTTALHGDTLQYRLETETDTEKEKETDAV